MPYGVMVTQKILVLWFRVRILVRQLNKINTRVTQLVRVPGLYPGGRGFKSLHEYSALLNNMCAPKTEIY